jgi:hypothetical protein
LHEAQPRRRIDHPQPTGVTFMKTKEKRQFIESIIQRLNDVVLPTWESPIIFPLSQKKTGFYVSLTKEEEFSCEIPWKEFASGVMESEIDVIERYLPLFEKLVKRMKKEVSAMEEFRSE